MRLRTGIGVLALGVSQFLMGSNASAAPNPNAVTITVQCGVMNAAKANDRMKCNNLHSSDGNGDADDMNSVELYSGGTLLYTETNAPILVDKDGDQGQVTIMLTGNGIHFKTWYDDAATSFFTAPDLTVKILTTKSKKAPTVQLFQPYVPVGSALWAAHSGDSSNLQAQIAKIIADAAADEIADDAEIAQEAAARAAADTALQLALAAEVTRATTAEGVIAANLATEVADRKAGDAQLQTNIDTVTAALNAEVTDRKNADTMLQNNINTEVADRKAGDVALQNSLNTEITDRKNADNALSAALAAEVMNRANGDNALAMQLATEAMTRQAADMAEATARTNGDAATLAAAKAYSDTFGITCPMGQAVVKIAAGGSACAPIGLPVCPVGNILVSTGGGNYKCSLPVTTCTNQFKETFTLTNKDLINLSQDCGTFYNSCAGAYGVHWKSSLPAGVVVSGVGTIKFAMGMSCNGPGTRQPALNGTPTASTVQFQNAQCCTMWDSDWTIDLPMGSYKGGDNQFLISDPQNCEGLASIGSGGGDPHNGTFATVTVTGTYSLLADLNANVNACGACGTVCTPGMGVAGTVCTNGTCGIGACNVGSLDCDGQYGNGCECGNLPNSVAKCGNGGACNMTCNAGFADCNNKQNDGCEIDLNSDKANCGKCGNACAGGTPFCSVGVCVAAPKLIGSYVVNNGPAWPNNPPTYTCQEACSLLFGGNFAAYSCSTVNQANPNHRAFVSGWGDGQFCAGNGQAENYKLNTFYNCGSQGCAYSAYVQDWCFNGATNFCFK